MSDIIGECSRCGTKQKVSKCQRKQTARVLLETEKGEKTITLFQDQLQALTSNAAGYSISDKLLGIEDSNQQQQRCHNSYGPVA